VERSAAIAAEFSIGVGCPQPMATSSALRINALDGPSRQILHAFSSSGMRRRFFRSWLTVKGEPFTENAHSKPIRSPGPGRHGKSFGDFAPLDLWCQEKRYYS